MNILAITGSPRKGNSEFLAKKFLEAVQENNETELINLREKTIKPCTGCDICFGTQMPCSIQDDDMEEIKNKMLKADLIVFSTPNYFKNMSGLMKIFIDRTNEMVLPPKLKGKKAFIIAVGGQNLENTKYCENTLKEVIIDHEMELVGSFLSKAEQPTEMAENQKLIKKLQSMAIEAVK